MLARVFEPRPHESHEALETTRPTPGGFLLHLLCLCNNKGYVVLARFYVCIWLLNFFFYCLYIDRMNVEGINNNLLALISLLALFLGK